MLSLTFFFTLLLLSFAAAQNSTLDPNSVDPTTKNQWCTGELNNCPILCGGQAHLKSQSCDGANLKYTCICSNGTEPSNIKQYLNTLPNHICNELFAQCRIANPGSQACQTCGTLNPTDVQAIPSSTSSSAPSSTAASTTAAAPSPSATSGKKSGAGRLEAVAGVLGGAVGLAAIML